MGEPLNNYSAVVEAIRAMTVPPFQLSPKKITLSTVHIYYSHAGCISNLFYFLHTLFQEQLSYFYPLY